MSSQLGRAAALRIGITAAAAVGLIAASSAGAVTYPQSGGNGFATDSEGWQGTEASCQPAMPGICTESNFYSGTQGNPAGSIEAQTTVVANAVDLFSGHATWSSPKFTATSTGSGTLSYDRQFLVTGIAALQPSVTVESVLVDDTTHKQKSLRTETIDGGSQTVNDTATPFSTTTQVVKAGTLALGDKYHLELRSTMSTHTARAGLTGTASVLYDNVGLELRDAGPDGSSGSDGVTFTHDPIDLHTFNQLSAKIDWSASKGDLPGGSIVPRKDCTIVGTAKSDHIHGSKGNDVICALGGKDRINGGGGHDIIDTGGGADRANGAGSKDIVAGLAGKDRVKGGPGSDKLGGGASNDRLSGGPKRDRINGGPGKDRALHSKHDRVLRVERRR